MTRRSALARETSAIFAGMLGTPLLDFMRSGLARALRFAPEGFRRELSLDRDGRLVDRELPRGVADQDEERLIDDEASVALRLLDEKSREVQTEEAFFRARLAMYRAALTDRVEERLKRLGDVLALPFHDGERGPQAGAGTIVPSVVPVVLLYVAALVVVAADGLNIAAPLADALGVDTRAGVGAAFRAQPVWSIAASVGGFAVAGAIGVGFRWLLSRRLRPGSTPLQTGLFALSWAAVVAVIVIIACSVALLRHKIAVAFLSEVASHDSVTTANAVPPASWYTWAVLTAAACFLAAWLEVAAERCGAARRERAAAHRAEKAAEETCAAQAREAEARLEQGDRLIAAQVQETQRELAGIAREREALIERARALMREVQERRSRAERRDTAFVSFVRAEVEADRAAWLRHAPRGSRRAQGAGLALLLAASLAAGCASPEQPASLHVVAFIADAPVRNPAASVELEYWIDARALDRPGSTFEAFTVDAAGGARPSFVACVPGGWGPGVVARRAAFLQAVRARFAAADRDAVVERCRPGTPASSTRVVIDLPTLSFRGGLPSASGPSLHSVLTCDRSSSGMGETRHSCDEADALAAFDDWVVRAPPGSTFELIVPGTDAASARSVFRDRVAGTDPVLELGRLLSRRAKVGPALPADGGSAIAEAISLGGVILMERQGIRELNVASDGRQISPRAGGSGGRVQLASLNFERAVPTPPERFVELMRERAILPRLAGVVVRHCGVHSEVGPRSTVLDPRAAADLRAAWTAYYAAAGVPGVELTTDCRETFSQRNAP